MKNGNLKSMSVAELWNLHQSVVGELTERMTAEQALLEDRLRKLSSAIARSDRRPYPRVRPKYRNPKNGTETWAGRGKQPRWLTAQLRNGKQLDDFRIAS